MKTLRIAAILTMIVGTSCFGIRPSYSQTPQAKKLLVGNNQQLYLVDFASGKALALPKTVTQSALTALSPDQELVAVVGQNGITMYRVSDTGIQQLLQVTQAACSYALWSDDSKSLSYIQVLKNPDGSTTEQVYLWNRDTGQTKRLL